MDVKMRKMSLPPLEKSCDRKDGLWPLKVKEAAEKGVKEALN